MSTNVETGHLLQAYAIACQNAAYGGQSPLPLPAGSQRRSRSSLHLLQPTADVSLRNRGEAFRAWLMKLAIAEACCGGWTPRALFKNLAIDRDFKTGALRPLEQIVCLSRSMKSIEFYDLPRPVQERFVAAARASLTPAPLAIKPAPHYVGLRWFVAAGLVLLGTTVFASRGFGDLE